MTNPVTRHLSLTGEINPVKNSRSLLQDGAVFDQIDREKPVTWYPRAPTKVQMVGFCDWLSMYQRHAGGLPILCDGAFMRIDREGVTVNTTLKKLKVEGSHETAVFIRCDGETVWFEGNVSKYGRSDNVFGFSFRECLLRINTILSGLGLPAFTEGERFITNFKGEPRTIWTGAMVTRVDITQNFATGSKDNAYYFMRYLQGQQASRLKTGTYGEGETVDWGRGSRVIYSKAYLKGPELRKHSKGDDYLGHLADWCDSVGLVRFETTFKSTKLHQLACHFLGGFDMKTLESEFDDRKEILTRNSVDVEELTELSKHFLSTYRMYQAGDDITSRLSRASFFRHRLALLPYGIDIAVKSNISVLKPRTRVVMLGPVSPPDFYELPQIERKRSHG